MRRIIWAALVPILACSEQDPATRGRVVESSAGTVELGIADVEYRPGRVAAAASLAGAVVARQPAADSTTAVLVDPRICGDSAVVREVRLSGTSLANALVWVSGINHGKPLPADRRETITIEDCRVTPRVAGLVTGTTVNVFSRDRATHALHFYREGDGTPVASVHFVDAGQVVPSESIAARPGIVEARCEKHPWVRGYVAVFDHPYFAVTDENGAFTIEQLPAGTYTVKVWHEGMRQPMEQRVAVAAGGTGRVQLAVALR